MVDLPACVEQVASYYGVPYSLVQAVSHVESRGNYRAINRSNKNGSEDIGLMQINSVWLPVLSKYGIRRSDLLDNPCVNAAVGSWILRKYFIRTGNWVDALSAYNAGPRRISLGRKYALKVIRYWYKIEAKGRQEGVVLAGDGG